MTTDAAIAEPLSAYKALFAFQQYRVSKLNLRLGFHSKRYAVFKRFLVFTKVVCESSWQESVEHEHGQGSGKIRDAYAKVMTTQEEAEFLYDPNDEITQRIDKVRLESLHAGKWKRDSISLCSDQHEKQMLSDRHKEALVNIENAKTALRGKLERYLSFRYVLP